MTSKFEYIRVTDIDKWKIDSNIGIEKNIYPSDNLTSEQWIFLTPNEQKLWDQIYKNSIILNDNLVAEPFTGIQSSKDAIYVIKKWTRNGDFIEFIDKNGTNRALEKDILKSYLLPANSGKNSFKSFETITNHGWIIFPYEVKEGKAKTIPENTFKQKFPNAYHYLSAFKLDLSKRDLDKHSTDWYMFGRGHALTKIENQPKIIVGVLFKGERYIYDENNLYFQTGGTAGYVGIKMRKNSKYSIFYILGLLNHPALEWVSSKKASTFVNNHIAHGELLLKELPIRKIDFSNPDEQKIHDQVVLFVKEIIEHHKTKKDAVTERDHSLILKQISEKRIELDKVINSLYDIDNLMKYVEVP